VCNIIFKDKFDIKKEGPQQRTTS